MADGGHYLETRLYARDKREAEAPRMGHSTMADNWKMLTMRGAPWPARNDRDA